MKTTTNKTLIVANWKMNFTMHEASLYMHSLMKQVHVPRSAEVVIAPTMFTLQSMSLQLHSHRQFKLAAQNFYWRDSGAYTGEVSASQLRGIVQYGIVGHSERRHIFHEHDKDVRAKVQAALRNEITPILCVGETASERTHGETEAVLHDQLIGGLANVTSDEISRVVIAYEPVWAIGTGDNAKPHDVQRAIRTIRQQIAHLYGEKAGSEVRVLYGGSVKGASASEYLKISGVNGLLVGGASLDLHEFEEIISAARTI
ncbi:triose-phosphate isomerase [Candidatus Saccharibacteria bacterium]|nr:triose-phosphate isomerase [Candidatus Saccharibacteria bacterium]